MTDLLDQDVLPGMPAGGAPIDPDAPYGRNPRTGEPYKRDPSTWAHLAAAREKAIEARKASGKAAGKKAPSKRTDSKAAAADSYGDKLAGLLKIGSAFIEPRSPLDAAIVRQSADRLAPIIDRLCDEDQRVADLFDRISRFLGPTGAWAELAAEGALTAGALALAHGVGHPILLAACGGVLLDAAAAAAASHALTVGPAHPTAFLPPNIAAAMGLADGEQDQGS